MKYITTPIYYVNDQPHIGHAVTTLAADVLARYWRLRGHEAFFLTGTDEHGAKIAQSAEASGETTKDFVDRVSQQFETAWQALNIQPDGFIRTTHPNHKAVVQRFLQKLYDTGAIYKGEYKGWYCVGCEEFKTETQIGPDNTCPIHLKPLIEVAEETYLFKLSVYQDQLQDLITSDKLKIQPVSRKNEVLGFITHEGLRDVAISRKNVAWGIPLPWDESHTVYVWVDALLNYLSASDPEGPQFKSGRKPEFPPTLQLIGKDILRFHALIWPALLLAADQPLPQELFVHGYFTIDGQKMSKSLGNVIAPQDLIDRYGIDGARYLLLASVPFGADGDISLEKLDALYTSDLANNLGNLVNRVQAMLLKYREGNVPQAVSEIVDQLEPPRALALDQWGEETDLVKGISQIKQEADLLNGLIESSQPWALAKDPDKEQHLDAALAILSERLWGLAVYAWPFMPDTSAKILALFGSSIDAIDYDTLGTTSQTAGKAIAQIEPLFPRLED